jgi:hypothetical protein
VRAAPPACRPRAARAPPARRLRAALTADARAPRCAARLAEDAVKAAIKDYEAKQQQAAAGK